jgi:hypothetical protein
MIAVCSSATQGDIDLQRCRCVRVVLTAAGASSVRCCDGLGGEALGGELEAEEVPGGGQEAGDVEQRAVHRAAAAEQTRAPRWHTYSDQSYKLDLSRQVFFV